MKKKKPTRIVEYILSADPGPPFHTYRIDKFHICKRCGFVLGSGFGNMPDCIPVPEEERKAKENEGRKILEKICLTPE